MKGVRRWWAPGKGHMHVLGLVHGPGGNFLQGFAKAHDGMHPLKVGGAGYLLGDVGGGLVGASKRYRWAVGPSTES